MKRKTKRLIVLCVILFILIIVSLLFARSRIGIALLKSKKHFITYQLDNRVLYEPGAEENAAKIVELLNSSIAKVEQKQFLPFKKPFLVYVCNTQESLNEYIAHPPEAKVVGVSVLGNVMISPRAFQPNLILSYDEVLLHELSHLHLRQRLGYFGFIRNAPAWFHEGLANMVAHEDIDEWNIEDVKKALSNGIHFTPEDKGTTFKMKRVWDYGIDYRLFHKQNALFVKFLNEKDSAAFKKFLLDILNGIKFPDSISRHYGKNVKVLWEEFEEEIMLRN